jgi:hypothetical protein
MKFWAHRALIGSVAIAGIAFLAACSSSTNDAAGANGLGGAAQGGSSASTGVGGTSSSGMGGLGGEQTLMGVAGTVVQTYCAGGGCACSDGKDNDGDGLIDGFDPECTGPLDNDEGSFATGIPGDNQDPKWQDCFFDGNSGGGDDGCRYATGCLTGDLPQTDKDCVLSQHCIDFCKRLIPNGCDCFGCCTVATGTGNVDILIGTSCSLEKIGDATACPVCKKSDSCNNTCATCELCPGKTVADLPASCAAPPPPTDAGIPVGPPPPSYTCDTGHQVCSATIACPSGEYCSLGCCLPFLR